jgi:hypothetical protein
VGYIASFDHKIEMTEFILSKPDKEGGGPTKSMLQMCERKTREDARGRAARGWSKMRLHFERM